MFLGIVQRPHRGQLVPDLVRAKRIDTAAALPHLRLDKLCAELRRTGSGIAVKIPGLGLQRTSGEIAVLCDFTHMCCLSPFS